VIALMGMMWASAAFAAPEWSAGAMASWRTTPLRGLWGPERLGERISGGIPSAERSSWYSEAGLHAVGSWRRLVADVSVGSEYGWSVSAASFVRYSGFRLAARGGVRVFDGPDLAGGEVEPIDVSLGAGAIGWMVCCSSSGGTYGPGAGVSAPTAVPTLYAANRTWLWEPLAFDVRYEVPLLRGRGFHNTVSVGVVFAARE
jgi:hypothetical protein